MKPIYTLDAETDPFKYGRVPMPFTWGFYRHSYDGRNKDVFDYTWGENCTEEMVNKLYELEPGIIYIHNGGRFDVYYLLTYILAIKKQLMITNNRIVRCYLPCKGGFHEIRDSWKLFNMPLGDYQKTKIDYSKFEKETREIYKHEIISYLKDDCKYLHAMCTGFITEAGKAHITSGAYAMVELKKIYDVGERLDIETDAEIRHKYYYGARVQCFEKGMIEGCIRYFDVNSMYPYVMAEYEHPLGLPNYSDRISDDTFFVTVEGTNKGALPSRDDFGEISFEREYGIFHCSIHEYITACELGLFQGKVLEAVNFRQHTKFDKFVIPLYTQRQQYKEAMKDVVKESDEWYALKLQSEIKKLALVNGYGKFAMNLDNYFEWDATKAGDIQANMERMSLSCCGCCEIIGTNYRQFACGGWHTAVIHGPSGYKLWKKPSNRVKLNNVATGASITGAARAVLLRGLHSVERPLYCDTDSIICSGDVNFEVHVSKLGAWKLEYDGDELALCGKKLYALFKDGECLKPASKGVGLNPEQIRQVAQGDELEWHNDAPTFGLDGSARFITRKVRMT